MLKQAEDAERSIAGPSSQIKSGSNFQSFAHLLDVRLLRALAMLEFSHPTDVQAKVLPKALAGIDIIARARTGSGKTLAYGLPLLQRILLAKKTLSKSDFNYQETRALILVPTRELSEQVTSQIGALLPFLQKDIKITNIARDASKNVRKIILAERPDIVVSTPSRAHALVLNGTLELKYVEILAIDEADLILSYGHDEALRSLVTSSNLSKSIQCICMSATMTQDVQALRILATKDAEMLDIPDPEISTLTQYFVPVTSASDKFLLTYVILRFRLIRGKCIIFVNNIDRCYKLKLFLQQFGIRSTVLNEELPVNSRYHIVQEFNRGVYDYIIAADDSRFGADAAIDNELKLPKNAKSSEYSVSRGIDFVSVSCVLNFDLPVSTKGYIHRIGRTARAGKTGTALSFIVPEEIYEKDLREGSDAKYVSSLTSENDEKVFAEIVKQQKSRHQLINEWKFDQKQIEAFRYRMEDALRSVTRHAIREARIKEIKQEILNSNRLKAHFEDNPTDLEYLRHDRALHPLRLQSHLKHIPQYLMPRIRSSTTQRIESNQAESGENVNESSNGLSSINFHKRHSEKSRSKQKSSSNSSKFKVNRRKDPLRNVRKLK